MQSYTRSGTQVRDMFGSIASRYDLANSVLSLGIHYLWRRKLVSAIAAPAAHTALDLCTGTGDLLPLLAKRFEKVSGADFCQPMLECAKLKLQRQKIENVELVQADAMKLVFNQDSFDLATVAFGVRNFEDLELGLSELRRVLRPNGQLLILEFGRPTWGVWRTIYETYSKYFLPLIGSLITGDRAAYEYLNRTSTSFPCGTQFTEMLRKLGFRTAQHRSLSGGIAYLYSAYKEV